MRQWATEPALLVSRDADPGRINATCRDGMLRVTVPRREASKLRQISVN